MGKNLAKSKTTFYFCDGGSCRRAGSEPAIRKARAHLRNKGLWDETHTIKTRCNGRCEDAPTWIVQSGNYWYRHVDEDKAIEIIDSHCDLNQPLESELLFKKGMDRVNSEKERPPVAVPVFELVQDPSLGEAYKARGFHSDQYLYPLFLFLESSPGSTRFSVPDGSNFRFSDLQEVDYTDPYRIKLIFKEGEAGLIIAPVPKTEEEALQKRKVVLCEYLVQSMTGHKFIRLKDKVGRRVAILHIGPEDTAIWEYCLKTQLNGARDPEST